MEEKENYFFAINVPESAIDSLQLAQSHLPRKNIRYSLAHYFHITLKFLGELSELEAMKVVLKAKEVALNMHFADEDLVINFTKTGMFFRNGDPAVIWVGAYLPSALLDFQRNLEEAMERVGFRMDKKSFRPHITLARVRDVSRASSEEIESLRLLGIQKKSFSINKFYLMKSSLTPHRLPKYEVISEYEFS